MHKIIDEGELTKKQRKKCDTYQLFLAENKNVPNETLFIYLWLVLCKPQGHTVTANIRHFSTTTHHKVMAPNSPRTSGVMVIKYLGTSASRLLSPFIHSGSSKEIPHTYTHTQKKNKKKSTGRTQSLVDWWFSHFWIYLPHPHAPLCQQIYCIPTLSTKTLTQTSDGALTVLLGTGGCPIIRI